MKCNQSRPVFERVSPCPFLTTTTITPRAPPQHLRHVFVDFFGCRIHRNPETLTTLLVQVRNFYYLLDFWVLDTRRERETIFTMLIVRPALALNSLTQPTRVHPAAINWTGLAQIRIPTRFVQSQISTNCFFQNVLESQPITSGHDVIHISNHISYPGFLL